MVQMNARNDWVGTRQLLRALRDVMASGGSPGDRLDQITHLIAEGMVAEVCSVYVLRGGERLVLYGTEGLRKDAVFRTQLAVGEGLIGNIAERARPLALAEAQNHPQFAYRPETGEEIFHSLLGVPILRNGVVHGVLVVQNQLPRDYTDEETEVLETIAMVLAEMVAAGDLPDPGGADGFDQADAGPEVLVGTRLNGGLAMGHAVLHGRGAAITQTVAEDSDEEERRMTEAVEAMQSALDKMVEDTRRRYGAGEHLEILDAYRMIADDRGWVRRLREAVRGGLTAEAAVAKIQNETRARMASAKDPYIRERLMDLDDLGYRLLQHLAGEGMGVVEPEEMPEDVILVARSIGPAELLDYDQTRLRAVIVDEGTATSHVSIVARALDIPMVGNARGAISKVEPMDRLLVDGDAAQVHVRPGDGLWDSFADTIGIQRRKRAELVATRNFDPVTKDGERVSLQINVGLPMEMANIEASGADGVGLCRTEIPFMLRAKFPRLDAQTALYKEILDAAGDKPVVFRTLDIGGDKLLPYFRPSEDDNPAMGWRALRMALDRPSLLRLQLRALIRAAGGRDLNVMFPMVSEAAEYAAAKALFDLEVERAAKRGEAQPRNIAVGCMLEVPALAFQIPQLSAEIDFLSVGSNDIAQFLFAIDRNNPRVADRYDVLSPAMLRFLKLVVDQADAAGVPVSLCGEMAGTPIEAMALIGLGFRRLSMSSSGVAAVRVMLRGLDVKDLSASLEPLLFSSEHSVRVHLEEYAAAHNIII
jgi:phosphotransferase system enzyme I (PtsP)